MADEEQERPRKGGGVWQAQPQWVRILTVSVGLPAWLYLTISVSTGASENIGTKIALFLFVTIAFIQLFFFARHEGFLD